MNLFRRHFSSRILALIAGLALLNMGFFMAEISMLRIAEGELMENVAQLILNTGAEEERDGESSGKSINEIHPLLHQIHIHGAASLLISINVSRTIVDHYRHANHSFLFSPPPDAVLS